MKAFRLVLSILLIVTFSASVLQAEELVYGPADINPVKNKLKFTDKFKAKNKQQATLRVSNGFDGKKAKSVTVFINGTKLVNRKKVNQKIKEYSTGVTLKKKNTIIIIVKGKGSKVRVQIIEGFGGFSLNKVIAVGDSVGAGYQDGSLVEMFQGWSFTAQFAKQANATFVLPLIGEPGIPPRLAITGIGIEPISNDDGLPLNLSAKKNNLCVPGADVGDALRTKSKGTDNPFYDIVLGGKQTMLEAAVAAKPTFILAWMGHNDILSMALNTDPNAHTGINDFARDFETFLKELKKTGATIVAANLIDVTGIALLTHPPSLLTSVIPADALVTIPTIQDLFSGKIKPESITGADYLDANEIIAVRQTVADFNNVISNLCKKYGVALIDAHAIFKKWQNEGVIILGQKLSLGFFGGIFGLDGVHPTNTAHAFIANEFIELVNSVHGAKLASIDVANVLAQDPHRPSGDTVDDLLSSTASLESIREALKILRSGKAMENSRRR